MTSGALVDAEAASDAPPGHDRLIVGAATAVLAVLGLVQIGRDSYWVDDGFTVAHASLSTDEFWHVLWTHEMNAAAYSSLMHLWVRFGDSEWWTRLPSVFFAAATVPLLYLLGRRLFGSRVAVVASVMLAVNAYVVEFAHEGRTYAFTLLLATASVLAFVRVIDAPSRGRWTTWVLVTALLGHAHFFGALVILTQVGALVARGPLATPRRALVKGFALIGVLLLPIAWFLVNGGDQGQVGHVATTTPFRFVGVFGRLVGNGGPLLLALVGVACAVALFHGTQRLRADHGVRTEQDWAFVLISAWVAVPVLTILIVSFVKPLFGARYFLLVVPALTLLAALGVSQIGSRRLAHSLLAAIVATSLVSCVLWYPRPAPDEFRAVAERVLAHAEPGDGIVFAPWFARVTFEVYADRQPDRRDLVEPLDPAPEWGDWLLIDEPPPLTDQRAQDLIAGQERIWLVERDGVEDAPQADDLQAMTTALADQGFTVADEHEYPGLTLRRYERR